MKKNQRKKAIVSSCSTQSICFYGIGGQGVLTAAEVCGWAFLAAGYHVKKTEVHGMAQRGGSVESYIRFGQKVQSPLPLDGAVDILVCLHEEEYPRLKDQLKKGGTDLFPFLEKAKQTVGEEKIFLNTFMLGVLSAHVPLEQHDWFEALDKIFKRRQDDNKKYFLKGYNVGAGHDL